MQRTPAALLAAATLVLLLGAGCKKEQPASSPAATPISQDAPIAVLPPTDAPPAGLVAPAPTTSPSTPVVPSAPPSTADAVAPTPPPTAPRIIRVIAKKWEFVPGEIHVRKDEHVVLEVTSTDVDHGIAIPDFNINRTLGPGTTERIDFTPDKVGSFSMVCSVFCGGGHRGMRGTLVVE